MASSARQAVACIFLLFVSVIGANSQSVGEKRPGATFTGKVTIKGKGAPAVAVGLLRIEESMRSASAYRTVTDDQGNYRITNVRPGQYQVTVSVPGFIAVGHTYKDKIFMVSKSETVENVDFVLMRGGVITGKVTDSDGRPVVEEQISLVPVERPQGLMNYGSNPTLVRTDDRGIYRVFGVNPGKYRVATGQEGDDFGARVGIYRRTFHPSATEASAATIVEVSEGGEAANVDITVPDPVAYYSAHGRIIDGDTGQPLANIGYAVQKYITENYTSGISTGAVSNKDGEFKLENLSPGKYAVYIQVTPDSDYRVESVRFEVVDRDVTGLTVKTVRGASVSGAIVLEGADDKTIDENLRNARVHAQISSTDLNSSSTHLVTVNPNGTFRIGGLQSGIVNFTANGKGFHVVRVERAGLAQPQGFELKEREQITGVRLIVAYANGSIQGVVRLAEGPIPANGRVLVSVKRLGALPTPFSDRGDSVQVDARGQFRAEGLLTGVYEVTAVYAPDLRTPWRRASQQVAVTNGAVSNVTITIDKP